MKKSQKTKFLRMLAKKLTVCVAVSSIFIGSSFNVFALSGPYLVDNDAVNTGSNYDETYNWSLMNESYLYLGDARKAPSYSGIYGSSRYGYAYKNSTPVATGIPITEYFHAHLNHADFTDRSANYESRYPGPTTYSNYTVNQYTSPNGWGVWQTRRYTILNDGWPHTPWSVRLCSSSSKSTTTGADAIEIKFTW